MKKKVLIIGSIILVVLLVLVSSYFLMNNMATSYYVYAENNKLILSDVDLKKKVDLTVNLGIDPKINVNFTKKDLYFADNYNNLFNLNKVSINDAFSKNKGEIIAIDVSKYNVVNDKLIYLKGNTLKVDTREITNVTDYIAGDNYVYYTSDKLYKINLSNLDSVVVNDLQNLTFLEIVNDNLVYRSNQNLYLNDSLLTDSLETYLGYKGAYYYVKADKLGRKYSNKVITKTDLDTPLYAGHKIILITSSTCKACQEFKETVDIVSETYNLTFYNYDYPTLDNKVKEGLNLKDLKVYPSLYIFDDKNNIVYFSEGKLSEDELVGELITHDIILLTPTVMTYTTAKYNTSEEIISSGESIVNNNYLIGTNIHKFVYNTDTNKLVNYPDSSIEIIEVLNNKVYYSLDSKYYVGTLTENGITSSSEITGEIIKVSGNNIISKINGEYLLGVVNDKYELVTQVSSKDLIYINNKTYYIKDNNVYNDNNLIGLSDYIFTSNNELYSVKDNTLSKVNEKNKLTLITNDFMKDLGIVKLNKK